MAIKETEEIVQIEEALRDIRMALKQSVTSVRILEGRLRRLKNVVEKGDSRKGGKSGSGKRIKQNPLQVKLNNLPLEERQRFLEELKA